MRRVLPTLLLVFALAAPAQAATTYKVKADDVYVRNKTAGYVLGTLFKGNTFEVQKIVRHGAWGYGRVSHGEFGTWAGSRCGYVLLHVHSKKGKVRRFLTSTKAKTASSCPPDSGQLFEKRLFRKGSFFFHAGRGALRPVQVQTCDLGHGAYGNYNPGTGLFASSYGEEPLGRGPLRNSSFGLRYITADGRAGLVKDTHAPLMGAPNWFFVPAGCLLRPPTWVGSAGGPTGAVFPVTDRRTKPRRVEPFKDAGVTKLRHWSLFGELRTSAKGTARINTCTPSCADGHYKRKRGARVTLSIPALGTCKGKQRFLYTHWTIRWPHGLGLPPKQSGELAARC